MRSIQANAECRVYGSLVGGPPVRIVRPFKWFAFACKKIVQLNEQTFQLHQVSLVAELLAEPPQFLGFFWGHHCGVLDRAEYEKLLLLNRAAGTPSGKGTTVLLRTPELADGVHSSPFRPLKRTSRPPFPFPIATLHSFQDVRGSEA